MRKLSLAFNNCYGKDYDMLGSIMKKIKSQLETMMHENPKVTILLGKTVGAVGESCPTATTDIKETSKTETGLSKLWVRSTQS